MSSKKRRSSIETIERFVKDAQQSPAEHARERRVSLTMMNCIWARNTDVETIDPVSGDITGKTFLLEIVFCKTSNLLRPLIRYTPEIRILKLCISKLMRHSVYFKFTENARLQLQGLQTFLGII